MPPIVLLSGFETLRGSRYHLACTGMPLLGASASPGLTHQTHIHHADLDGLCSFWPSCLCFLFIFLDCFFFSLPCQASTCPEALAPPPFVPGSGPYLCTPLYPYVCTTRHKCSQLLNFCGFRHRVGCQPFGEDRTT